MRLKCNNENWEHKFSFFMSSIRTIKYIDTCNSHTHRCILDEKSHLNTMLLWFNLGLDLKWKTKLTVNERYDLFLHFFEGFVILSRENIEMPLSGVKQLEKIEYNNAERIYLCRRCIAFTWSVLEKKKCIETVWFIDGNNNRHNNNYGNDIKLAKY